MGVEVYPSPSDRYVICTSSTRPQPFDGLTIYETDTFKTLTYIASKGGWFPPWNTAWGVFGSVTKTTTGSAYSATTNTDLFLNPVSVRADRNYRVHAHTLISMSAAAVWLMELRGPGAVIIDRMHQINEHQPWGEVCSASVLFQPATTDANYGLWFTAVEFSGTATLTLSASATSPRSFWIEDIGPR